MAVTSSPPYPARDFPEAHLFVLAPARRAPREDAEQRDGNGQIRVHTTIAPIVAALDCAPRRPRRIDDDARKTEQAREPEAID